MALPLASTLAGARTLYRCTAVALLLLTLVMPGRAARDGEAQAGVGKAVATKKLRYGAGQFFIFVLQRDKEGLTGLSQPG